MAIKDNIQSGYRNLIRFPKNLGADLLFSRDRSALLGEFHNALKALGVKVSKMDIRRSGNYDAIFGSIQGAQLVRDLITNSTNNAAAKQAKGDVANLLGSKNCKKIIAQYDELRAAFATKVPLTVLARNNNTGFMLKNMPTTLVLLKNIGVNDKGKAIDKILNKGDKELAHIYRKADSINRVIEALPESKRVAGIEALISAPQDKMDILLASSKKLAQLIEKFDSKSGVEVIKAVLNSDKPEAMLKHPTLISKIAGNDVNALKAISEMSAERIGEIASERRLFSKFESVFNKEDRVELIRTIGRMPDTDMGLMMRAMRDLSQSMSKSWFSSAKIDINMFKEVINSAAFDVIAENSVKVAKIVSMFAPNDRQEAASVITRIRPDELQAVVDNFKDAKKAIAEVPREERLNELMKDFGIQPSHRQQAAQNSLAATIGAMLRY